jgi:predicted transcriptional regulator
MEHADLSDSQRRLLTALVDVHRSTASPVKAATIADEVGNSATTVRNQIQSLTALGLVEGIQGPKGGYRPTAEAYDVLDRQDLDEPEQLTLAREFGRVDATVEEIDFLDVNDPETCVARVRFDAADHGFETGDAVAFGPTPVAGLLLAGEVVEVRDSGEELLLKVAAMEAPAE